jgi:hypothetical protein
VTNYQLADRYLEADCRELSVEVGDGGTFLQVHAKSEDPVEEAVRPMGIATTPDRSTWRAVVTGQQEGLQDEWNSGDTILNSKSIDGACCRAAALR